MKESALQTKVMKYLKSQGIYARKLHDSYTSGLPDIMTILPGHGRACFFELKSATGKLSKIQAWEGTQIMRAGGVFFLVRSLDEVKNCLRGVL